MRYSSALVLSTIVVGQAAAANIHHRHASFHARRQAEAKRDANVDNVDWSKVAYDLNDVDWDSVFNSKPSPTPAAQVQAQAQPPVKPSPSPAVAEVKQVPQSPSPSPKPSPSPSPAGYPTAAPAKSSPAASPTPSPTQQSNNPLGDLGDQIDDIVGDLLNGLQSMITGLGAKIGKNPKTNENGIWIGGDSPWKAQFTNDHPEDAVLFCWRSNDFKNMCLNEMQPEISVGLKSGQSVELSFAEKASAACAPAYASTKLAMFGGIYNTWWEVTFGQDGAFDVSRNVNMKGTNISSKGSKCTSDMDTCVFKCKDGMDSCEKGEDYDLFNCGAGTGGGGGYDPIMAGTGGGCAMGRDSETVKVVFS